MRTQFSPQRAEARASKKWGYWFACLFFVERGINKSRLVVGGQYYGKSHYFNKLSVSFSYTINSPRTSASPMLDPNLK